MTVEVTLAENVRAADSRAALRLFWIAIADSPRYDAQWRAALAPEIDLIVVLPGSPRPGGQIALDGRPYAVAGHGPAAAAAFDLARHLAATYAPVCLIVADAPAPAEGTVDWPIVAFATSAARRDTIPAVAWRQRTTHAFAARLLPDGETLADRPAIRTLLAIKEELHVWPA
jgi:hypothetical protein